MSGSYAKICATRFGFAFGFVAALIFFLVAVTAMFFEYGITFVAFLSHFYNGYAPSWIGGLWGALWGFVDFFIFTWLVAKVYNCCACKKSACHADS